MPRDRFQEALLCFTAARAGLLMSIRTRVGGKTNDDSLAILGVAHNQRAAAAARLRGATRVARSDGHSAAQHACGTSRLVPTAQRYNINTTRVLEMPNARTCTLAGWATLQSVSMGQRELRSTAVVRHEKEYACDLPAAQFRMRTLCSSEGPRQGRRALAPLPHLAGAAERSDIAIVYFMAEVGAKWGCVRLRKREHRIR